jgi:hypothetical protein
MLIDGLEHGFDFSILGISSSQLTFIFFRGVGIPPTRMKHHETLCSTDRDDRVLPLFLWAIFLSSQKVISAAEGANQCCFGCDKSLSGE